MQRLHCVDLGRRRHPRCCSRRKICLRGSAGDASSRVAELLCRSAALVRVRVRKTLQGSASVRKRHLRSRHALPHTDPISGFIFKRKYNQPRPIRRRDNVRPPLAGAHPARQACGPGISAPTGKSTLPAAVVRRPSCWLALMIHAPRRRCGASCSMRAAWHPPSGAPTSLRRQRVRAAQAAVASCGYHPRQTRNARTASPSPAGRTLSAPCQSPPPAAPRRRRQARMGTPARWRRRQQRCRSSVR